MNAAELVVLDFERKHDVVVEAKPDVGGAPSRVEVANYLDVRVAYHLAMSARKLEREQLLDRQHTADRIQIHTENCSKLIIINSRWKMTSD